MTLKITLIIFLFFSHTEKPGNHSEKIFTKETHIDNYTEVFSFVVQGHFMGCGMGPLLVLVSPCFRKM